MSWFLLVLSLGTLLFFGYTKSYFVPSKKGVLVLMYHKISGEKADSLTVTTQQLNQHFEYLNNNKYQCITCQQWIAANEKLSFLPHNPILITFDDGYQNNFELAFPILQAHQLKATVFLPTAFIGKTNEWDGGEEKLMTLKQIKSVDPAVVEWAMHTHTHQNFKNIGLAEMENELKQNLSFFEDNGIAFIKALAYPYGGRPKNSDMLKKMKAMLIENKIDMAFRIGNKINDIKPNDIFEIKRIDIKGTDSFGDFESKLMKGGIRLF